MTRVDFYVSNQPGQAARLTLACRIAEKAYQQKHQIYLHAGSAEQAQAIDAQLWTFRAGSFIPHALVGDEMADQCPILIGYEHTPDSHTDVLINLDQQVPSFFSRFERVAELINQDEETRQQGRDRFRFYRDRGYALETHNLND